MALSKILKSGSLITAGALVGGLLTYNSKKPEIVAGINDISNMAIEYKTQAKELLANKEDLEESISSLKTRVDSLTTEVEQLTNEKAELEQQKAELQSQANLDTNKINELTAKIKELETIIAEKDSLIEELNRGIENWKNEYYTMFDMWQTSDIMRVQAEKEVKRLKAELEASKNDTQSVTDEANKEIEKANQDQVDILNTVNQAKENINNN